MAFFFVFIVFLRKIETKILNDYITKYFITILLDPVAIKRAVKYEPLSVDTVQNWFLFNRCNKAIFYAIILSCL